MPDDVRILGLGDMLWRRKGSLTSRLVQAIFSIALRLFFRRIETSRAGLVPADGALIFVLNHPNGLIDPALVFCAMPRRISFLAKSTLFNLPVASFLLRTVEALPLYRHIDEGADTTLNQRTFKACHELLRRGRCIALFPEGVSHSEPRLLPVKTGAARIALGALSLNEKYDGALWHHEDGETPTHTLTLKIVPVGLYYTSKTTFRSEALLRFGQPLEVAPVASDENGEPSRPAVRELSERIAEALREVTLNADTEEQLEVARRTEKLFSSIYESINIERTLTARFDFLHRFVAAVLSERQQTAAQTESLRRRIFNYEEELRRIGITPENLSLTQHSGWYVFRHFLLRSILLILLFPLTLAGAALHIPAYLSSTLFARIFAKHGVDDARATVKILAAILLMPLTWLVFSGLSFYLWGWRAGVVTLPLAIICGYTALRSLEALYDIRGWFKAMLLLFRRRHLFLRLLRERRTLHNAISKQAMKSNDE